MELFTVTLAKGDTLLSVPLNHVQGLGETKEDQQGFIIVRGDTIRTNEDYGTLVEMWQDLTGTGAVS